MEVQEEQRVEQVQISERKRTVALAVDGSAHSEHAFQFYWAHIHKDGDFLVLIHCPEMYDLTDASPAMADRLVKEKKTQISSVEKKYMELLKEKGAHLNGSFRTGQGKPGEAICRIADEEKAAVIVCGTRGLGTIRRTIMGSVSDYIVHHSHVPVLLGTLFCALVDCSHQAMTALFEYSGSLALLVANWLISARTHISITDINPIRKLNALINIKHGTSQQEERHKGFESSGGACQHMSVCIIKKATETRTIN